MLRVMERLWVCEMKVCLMAGRQGGRERGGKARGRGELVAGEEQRRSCCSGGKELPSRSRRDELKP